MYVDCDFDNEDDITNIKKTPTMAMAEILTMEVIVAMITTRTTIMLTTTQSLTSIMIVTVRAVTTTARIITMIKIHIVTLILLVYF